MGQELNDDQAHIMQLTAGNRALEDQMKEMTVRLEEAEAVAAKYSRKKKERSSNSSVDRNSVDRNSVDRNSGS